MERGQATKVCKCAYVRVLGKASEKVADCAHRCGTVQEESVCVNRFWKCGEQSRIAGEQVKEIKSCCECMTVFVSM